MNFGEGDYRTEQLIRQLLVAAHPRLRLPPPTNVPNPTPTGEMNPETYVGYERLQYLVPAVNVAENAPAAYHFPTAPARRHGPVGTWTEHAEEATAGQGAGLELSFLARKVYLVLGGSGTARGEHQRAAHRDDQGQRGAAALHAAPVRGDQHRHPAPAASPGVQAYDFTFG